MKKLWIISVLGVILVGGTVVWFLFRQKGLPTNQTIQPLSPTTSTRPVISPDQIQKDKASLSEKINKIAVVDEDIDGLSNQEEKKYGTDPANPDTDGDGLLDKDEVFMYRTNPLISDTDGDGLSDGYEADRGTNPLQK